jgi:hypothetical protein
MAMPNAAISRSYKRGQRAMALSTGKPIVTSTTMMAVARQVIFGQQEEISAMTLVKYLPKMSTLKELKTNTSNLTYFLSCMTFLFL